MGDRTSVTLTVLTSCVTPILTKLLEGHYGHITCGNYAEFSTFEFYEVNHGDLPFLDELQQKGIAYDSDWDSGDEYGSGTQSCRFTSEGVAVIKSIYDDELDPPISMLLKYIDAPEQLRQYILNHRETHTALPWDNQESNGKTYQTIQLITR